MNNFILYNPTRIFFGEGEISKLKTVIDKKSKVLIVYGGESFKKYGAYQQTLEALAGYSIFEFGGIEPNPDYSTCLKVVSYIKKQDIDFILAVGGASVIDAVKFISAAVYFDGEPWDILAKAAAISKVMPLGTILTIAATGSEMNCASVISRRETGEKRVFFSDKVFPKFSILDPVVTYTLPKKQISNGVVDAFVHVMEQYMTFPQHADLQDGFAETILKSLINNGPKALENPEDYNVRANIMFSATMALNGLIGSGVVQDWATHQIGHSLTACHNLDHGQTLAIVYPSVLKYKKAEKADKLVQYAERVLNIDSSLLKEQKIDLAIAETEEFFNIMGLATKLKDYSITQKGIDALVNNVARNSILPLGERQDIYLDDVRKILEISL
ncbi:NADH-dependent alcohol dehydrogenase [Francisella opportunistica]|uniref:NADH-dependent alcohol dehydrogenase n=1 Tax=Francisella opportunistica TaxID=2016517 RepID=A0A345JRP9_9GAMM|nr:MULTISPECIES: iron-containing alcohol dehydrogenase [Francisella]APC91735.1 putative oxidoreductase YqhD [Francisella sp. MA067296]AXH29995.1 NADH-dependent alcohol dehydrogenase [Francisella opportunistica]AXH31639.1 NADH-dependent alcohol dehydrogenase [Francisella opportunistica]